MAPINGGRKGGSYLDITATHPKYGILRVNTVDVYKTGKKAGQITKQEIKNAKRIRTQMKPGEHLLLVKKR